MGTSTERTTLTKFAGGWGFMVAAVAFYDGTAALMKVRLRGHVVEGRDSTATVVQPGGALPCPWCSSSPLPAPPHRLPLLPLPLSLQDVYGKQILPVFPLKPVNKVSLGDFGTKRFVDPEAPAKA